MKKELVIIAILSVCVLGLGGFVVYDQFIKDEPVVEDLNELGYELYLKTIFNYDTWTYPLYDGVHVTYDNLSNQDKLNIAYYYTPNKGRYIDSFLSHNDNYAHTGDVEYVLVKDFEVAYKNIFGNDKNIEYQDFDGYWADCYKREDTINCSQISGGDVVLGQTFIYYDSVRYENSDIVIKVKYLYLDETNIYNDPDANNLIATIIESDIFATPHPHDSYKTIYNMYGSKAGIFEIVFKKDSLGKYYWYESKFIEN